MAPRTPAPPPAAPRAPRLQASVTQVSSTGKNRTFRLRIAYKSGLQQEYTVEASATSAFEAVRAAYAKYLAGGTPVSGNYAIPMAGNLSIDWREVAAVYSGSD